MRQLPFSALLLSCCLAWGLFACESATPESEEELFFHPNRFEDPVLRTIHDLQDRRRADSLQSYLMDSNATYRKEAAMAMANVQDGGTIPFLTERLAKEEDPEVAGALAYAIGLTYQDEGALALRILLENPDSLWQQDGGKLYAKVVEALGNCGKELDLEYVTYKHDELGKPEADLAFYTALYRFHLRKVSNAEVQTMAAYALTSPDVEVARMAANSLGRLAKADTQVVRTKVLPQLPLSKDDLTKMAAVRILRHLPAEEVEPILFAISTDPQEEFRTRVNAIYTWTPPKDSLPEEALHKLLNSGSSQLAVATASALRTKSEGIDKWTLHEWAAEQKNLRVRAELTRLELKETHRTQQFKHFHDVEQAIMATLESDTASQYHQRNLLIALSENPQNADFLKDVVLKNPVPKLRSGAMEGMFNIYDQDSANFPLEERLNFFKACIASGDAAVIAMAGSELGMKGDDYRDLVEDTKFLDEAMKGLELPLELETFLSLQRAQWELDSITSRFPYRHPYDHPIDWDLCRRISSDATATLRTSKGDIRLALLVDEMPATVVNFVELAQSDYFDGKFFHRIVPNFVAQAGCPRGDGWGGYPTIVRSEMYDLPYETGSVGMASAGKDTEGSQIFITHCPTPHLDDRYSMFAKVISGMDIVQELQMGDEIMDVILSGVKPAEVNP